jgi:hypothetical protein
VGGVWVKSALFFQRTDDRFDESGRRVEWIGSGESDARAIYTDLIIGLHENIDVWIQIPWWDLRFDTVADSLRSTGFGDIRAWVRWKVTDLGNGSTPIALRLGAKAPLGDSPLDAQVIPLGDGQWDLEGFGEIGHSFWPTPIYAELWLGYRARLENTEKLKDPGGEFVLLAETGINPTPRTLLKATVDGFWGRNWIVEGIRTGTKRRILHAQFTGAFEFPRPVWTEIGIRVPLSGRNFPAGPQMVVGISAALR